MTLSMVRKYNSQAEEASERLWIDTTNISVWKTDTRPVVDLWWYNGENITLAKALRDISDSVRIVLFYDDDNYKWDIELEDNTIIPAKIFRKAQYIQHQHPNTDCIHTWNAYGMLEICGDKFLTNFILARNGIPVAKQKRVSLGKEYPDFWNNYVVKWRAGCGWKQVQIFRQSNVFRADIILNTKLIIEELIESYPIHIEWVKKDWNLRVLVTFDTETQRYITAGIVWRIDTEGWPVNLSISAENISFHDVSKLCGWSEDESKNIESEVKRTAEISCEILTQAGNRKCIHAPIWNFQTVFWVDIIINANKKPIVLEVNDSDSWCIYELAQLHGIKSIYPIAQSILDKIDIIEWIKDFFLSGLTKFPEDIWDLLLNRLFTKRIETKRINKTIKILLPSEFIEVCELNTEI